MKEIEAKLFGPYLKKQSDPMKEKWRKSDARTFKFAKVA